MSICLIDDCDGKLIARGLCGKHYQRWYKHGGPLVVKPRAGNSTLRPVVIERTCRTCGFHGSAGLFIKTANLCKPCKKDYTKNYYEQNPRDPEARKREWTDHPDREKRNLKRRAQSLGFDFAELQAYIASHEGLCDICGIDASRDAVGKSLSVDHDHTNGEFRGILCSNCNNGLGRFKDNISFLESAIDYLKRDRPPLTRVSPPENPRYRAKDS